MMAYGSVQVRISMRSVEMAGGREPVARPCSYHEKYSPLTLPFAEMVSREGYWILPIPESTASTFRGSGLRSSESPDILMAYRPIQLQTSDTPR
jgi:hypothetical protein